MLDEHFLSRRRSALHAVDHHAIGPRLDGKRGVVIGPRPAHLHIDGLFPVGDLAQLQDLDLEIVGTRPVGVPAGRALIDAGRQAPHRRHPLRDLLAEQHAAAPRLGALPDHLDGVGSAQIVRVHAVARRQILIDEDLGMAALLRRHAAIAGRRRGPGERCAAPQRLLGFGRQRAEAHAGNGDRDLELDRSLREAGANGDPGAAFLAIAFERVARDRCPEEQEIVEMRQLAFRTGAANVIDAGDRGAADLRQRVVVEGG